MTMRRLVALLAALAPAACFKLPWSRSAAPKSGGYQLGDISKAVYQTWKDQKDGKESTPAVSDVYDYGYRGRSEYALDMPRPEFKFCPPREMTGVPVEITRACATFSGQMYEVTDPTNPRNEFELSTDGFECNMVLEDLRHESPFGSSQATNPPFAVALTRDSDAVTLICCWRGSTTMEDWAINFAATPVHSASWYDVAPGLRTHGAYTTTVESDITKHTTALLSLIDMYEVTRLVFTGHSLAGGTACLGTYVVSGRMKQAGSPWAAVADKVDVRTVAFSAPGAIIQDVSKSDDATQSFVKDVSSRCVNLIAWMDIVPRVTTDLDFMDAYLEDTLPALAKDAVGRPLPKLLYWLLDARGKIDSMYDKGKDSEPVQALLAVGKTLMHGCPLILWEDDQSEPVLVHDHLGPTDDKAYLEAYKYKKLKRGEDPVQRVLYEHSLTYQGLSYNKQD